MSSHQPERAIFIITDGGILVYERMNTVTSGPCAVTTFDALFGLTYSDLPDARKIEAIFVNSLGVLEIFSGRCIIVYYFFTPYLILFILIKTIVFSVMKYIHE